ncbi:MAG TPA: FkbM family methyltransferase [Candidatus Limnocylindria bacterium]|nr:FkbM family methyltransferase [Candidatus Limnocylindria bacterium]
MRQGVKRAVIAAGLEAPARALVTRIRRRSRVWDRTMKDYEHRRMLLAFALPSDANCVDVGAANGFVLETILRVAPHGRHIAYEPLAEFHTQLASRFPQVDVRPVALSDKAGEVTFTHVTDRPHVSGFSARDYRESGRKLETIRVRTARLDDDLPEGYVPDLLKVDVEGAEELVFRGALRTLQRHRPIVAFQHGRGSAEYYGTKPGDIFRLLTADAGLRIFDMDGGGPYTLSAFETAYETNAHFHFVART